MTARDLAERAGVSPALIVGIEAGNPASLETYARVATALGLRLELDLLDRRSRSPARAEVDLVHAAMGEMEARRLRQHRLEVGLDVPYQHFQFAGRADLVAWDTERRVLLHIENRSRFPDLQGAFGSFNAKRSYFGAEHARRVGLRGWRSETHVMAGLWSSEVLHVIRLRWASFESICPDGPESFLAWWAGEPPASGSFSALVVMDPTVDSHGSTRRTAFRSLADARRIEPRFRGYADAAAALRAGDGARHLR